MSEINWGLIATAFRVSGHIAAITELKRQGHVIMPLHATGEMIEEGMYPARPGSLGDIYREMVKVGQVTA